MAPAGASAGAELAGEMVAQAERQLDDREGRIGVAGGRKNAAAADVEIRHGMDAAIASADYTAEEKSGAFFGPYCLRGAAAGRRYTVWNSPPSNDTLVDDE